MGARLGLHAPLAAFPSGYELSNLAGGLSMNRLFLKLAMMLMIGSLLYSTPAANAGESYY